MNMMDRDAVSSDPNDVDSSEDALGRVSIDLMQKRARFHLAPICRADLTVSRNIDDSPCSHMIVHRLLLMLFESDEP